MAKSSFIRVGVSGLLIVSVLGSGLAYVVWSRESGPGRTANPRADLRKEALDAAAAGRDDEALKKLAALKMAGERDPEIYINATRVYLVKQFTDMALDEVTEGLQQSPRDVDLLLLRADIYLRQGYSSRAIDDCRTAVRLQPQNAAAFQLLAIAHCENGQLPLADQWLEESKQLDQSRAAALAKSCCESANRLTNRGKAAEAQWALQKSQQLDPLSGCAIKVIVPTPALSTATISTPLPPVLDSNVHLAKGIEHLNNKVADLAVVELEKYTKLQPENAEAWLRLSEAYLGINEPHHTLFASQKAISLGKEDAEVHLLMARAYAAQERHELALTHLRETERRDPQRASQVSKLRGSVYQIWGAADLKVSKLDEAIQHFQLAADNDPALNSELAKAYLKRADAGRRSEKFEQAFKDLATAIKVDPTREADAALAKGKTHFDSAQVAARDGDYRGAIDEYRRAKEASATLTPRVDSALAKLYRQRSGELRRAGMTAEAQLDTDRANALDSANLAESGRKR